MAQDAFWERTWRETDRERVRAYVDRFDMAEDAIIRFLRGRGAKTVCDAGCGCGAYALKLAAHGFSVFGFDISPDAAALAEELLSSKGYPAGRFRAGDALATGWTDARFDAVVARDVLDHMPIREGMAALAELCRIVRPGGCVLLTLDGTDEEYESEPHTVNADGDHLYTAGKWAGMAFHPYDADGVRRLTGGRGRLIGQADGHGVLVALEKE